MLASFMCASAAMKATVDSPSHSEREASTRLIGARNCVAWPNASAIAPISSEHIRPRTKIDFADRVGQEDLLHQHVVDGVRRHAAANGRDAALIVAQ